MSMKLFDLKKQHKHAVDKADSIVMAAETAGRRELTASEDADVTMALNAAKTLGHEIAAIEKKNTLMSQFTSRGMFDGAALLASAPASHEGGRAFSRPAERVQLSEDYANAFHDYVRSNGMNTASAALYEGAGSQGGFVVPSIVDQQIVPLAPTDMGVRSIATVIPTAMDIKIPRATTISTATAKAESGASTNLFTESEFVLDQFTLFAFMAGLTHIISWELAQDVPSFQQFAVGDMLLGQSLFEENWYVNGTGTGQPQGLIGNTGAGVTGVLVGSDGYGSELLDATYDVQGLLKGAYHEGASFLMQRATGVLLRKAQKQANLFEPVFTRSNGQDYLHGYPVTYSTAMPAIAAGATPVLFGNFKLGYVIGDRGGSGINVKILDQPLATAGQIILLSYRRTDGRIRRSEAIQAITLHS
jgi:HK97 family phage major capsid protein